MLFTELLTYQIPHPLTLLLSADNQQHGASGDKWAELRHGQRALQQQPQLLLAHADGRV